MVISEGRRRATHASRAATVVGRRKGKRKKRRTGEGRMPMVRGNNKNGSVNVRARIV